MKKNLFVAAIASAALMVSCGGNETSIRMGSLSSDFDTLSYALGANIATGIQSNMGDIPFDFKVIEKGMQEQALGKASEDHDTSIENLRTYFIQTRGQRHQEISKKRAEADSIRLAEGDTTKVEYPVADPAMFDSEKEREELSYSLGSDIGFNLTQDDMPLQLVWIAKGMQDVVEKNAQLNDTEVNNYLRNYFMVVRPAEKAAESQAWLEKQEKKSGVQKTASGLLYRIDKMGDETIMAEDPRDVVKVHYTGRNTKGKVFDSSRFANCSKEQQKMLKQQRPNDYDKDEPIEFALNRVIPGWTEGMMLVGKGGKITLWLPAELAYGPRGAGRDIGPNEALEFEVELIDVTPYEAPKAEENKEEAKAEATK